MSFNDIMMAIMSVSMYNFFESKGKIEEEIGIVSPFSFKKNAKTAETLELSNTISGLFYGL